MELSWQSMDTAPRDGTVISIRCDYGIDPWFALARWTRERTAITMSGGDFGPHVTTYSDHCDWQQVALKDGQYVGVPGGFIDETSLRWRPVQIACLSTHGGAGYAPGSYRDGDAVICGSCGFRIENPTPNGWRHIEYSFADVRRDWRKLFAWLRGDIKETIPVWYLQRIEHE